MRLLRLDVEGFRSLQSISWSPGSLNLIIGPNGSGKSNLLSSLELLSQCASGHLGEYIQAQGGMAPVVWDGSAKEVSVRAKTTSFPPYVDEVRDALTYEIVLSRLGKTSGFTISRELLGNFYSVEANAHAQPSKLLERDPRHAVVFSIARQRLEAPPDSVPDEESLLSVAGGPFAANEYVSQFREAVAGWAIYQGFQTHREAQIRQATVARHETRVQPDGQNLVAVLHTLYTGNRDFKNEVNEAMHAAFGQDFEELLFPPAADQRVQLRLRWKSLHREQSAADLSDGTLRFLFLLTVLANPDPPALIAIDEPETGLHPSMLPIVAEYAQDAATRTQVLLTTHSPELLDAFSADSATTSIVEWREGQTALRVLSGEELAYWLERYSLGELYRSKELEALE